MPSVAEIVRRHGPEYVRQFGARMSADQLRVLRDIARCRTPAMGGHRWLCPNCEKEHFSFHSCGNRHCPTCGADDAKLWLQRQQALLLPVLYHLCTVTVPESLRRPIRSHPRQMLPLLFWASASSVLDLYANPEWVGAIPGMTAVLHTWTRQLEYHPHIHFLLTGGGLAPDGSWREAHRAFIVPVAALSSLVRARFRDGLRQGMPELFATLPQELWHTSWVAHSEPVGSGANALLYLSRYILRVAISNSAILSADATEVRFRYRRCQDGKARICTLRPQEFLRRFLQHVLPKGFVKVRYYGLHHHTRRPALRLLRASLCIRTGQPMPSSSPVPPQPAACLCPRCHTPMLRAERIAPAPTPPLRRHPLETSPP